MIPHSWRRISHLVPLLEVLFDDGHAQHALLPDQRALIALAAGAVTGRESAVEVLTRRALATGATPAAVVDVLLTAALSRGARVMWAACEVPELLAGEQPLVVPSPGPVDIETYLKQEFRVTPAWVRWLQRTVPAMLHAYLGLRQVILADNALPRKFKELVTIVLNALDNNLTGMRAHGSAALHHGATPQEILEALAAAIPVGGIIVWINGVRALAPLLAGAAKGRARVRQPGARR